MAAALDGTGVCGKARFTVVSARRRRRTNPRTRGAGRRSVRRPRSVFKPMHIWSARDPARQTNNARFDSSRHNL